MKLTVSVKLFGGFFIAMLTLVALSWASFSNITHLLETSRWVHHTHEVLNELSTIRSHLQDTETGQRGFLLTGDPEYLRPYESGEQGVHEAIQRMEQLTSDHPAQQERIQQLRPSVRKKLAELAQTIELRRTQGFESALAIVKTDAGKQYMDEIRHALGAMEQEERDLLVIRGKEAEASALTTSNALVWGTAFAVLTILMLAYVIVRSIKEPLDHTVQLLNQVAEGNISHNMQVKSSTRDEIGQLGDAANRVMQAVDVVVSRIRELSEQSSMGNLSHRAPTTELRGEFAVTLEGANRILDGVQRPLAELSHVLERVSRQDLTTRVQGNYEGDYHTLKTSVNTAIQHLNAAMSRVKTAALEVNSAGVEIAQNSDAFAQGAQEQSSALQQISSSLEQYATMARANAENTELARSLSEDTNQTALNGGHGMKRMLEAMSKIQKAAEGTGEIIRDINEIALQTNLLALNAAVEAARAGDAGRGFAVVAEEVRTLAQRSKESAKKTEVLIQESVNLAEEGQDISKEVDDNLANIVESILKVSDLMIEIARASQEQTRGIEHINQGLAGLDIVAKRSTEGAKDSAMTAQGLHAQSQELSRTVTDFQLGTLDMANQSGTMARIIELDPPQTQATATG